MLSTFRAMKTVTSPMTQMEIRTDLLMDTGLRDRGLRIFHENIDEADSMEESMDEVTAASMAPNPTTATHPGVK